MCGIFGCIGSQFYTNCFNTILDGIDDLRYRGYDSMGVALLTSNQTQEEDSEKVVVLKTANQGEKQECSVEDLKQKVNPGQHQFVLGIGHTRWGTVGKKTVENAHPHSDPSASIFVVHNGNVENHRELRKKIKLSHLKSETDTEVIAHLIAQEYEKTKDLTKAVRNVMQIITGGNAILVIHKEYSDRIIAATNGSSLHLVKNIGQKNQVVYISSCDTAFKRLSTEDHLAMNDKEIAIIRNDGWKIEPIFQDKERRQEKKKLLETYSHHMISEIMSQPDFLADAMAGRFLESNGVSKLGGIGDVGRGLREVDTFHFIGCGTAYIACEYGKKLFNRFGISAEAWLGSEFGHSYPVFSPQDAFIFVSQSGETADTISALEEVRIKGNICLGIVNAAGSKIDRATDAGIRIRAGTEIAVASTKAFTSQLVCIALLALFLARQRTMTEEAGRQVVKELRQIPEKVNQVLKQARVINAIAEQCNGYQNSYFMGRNFSYIVAKEGALKLKEITYYHAEAYALGEMKHGPLALVDKHFLSVVIIPKDSVYNKGLINLETIRANNGKVLAITTTGNHAIEGLADFMIYVPKVPEYLSPMVTTIPLQLLAYYMAVQLGHNPDEPRNLAKSVTVA